MTYEYLFLSLVFFGGGGVLQLEHFPMEQGVISERVFDSIALQDRDESFVH